MSTVIDGSIGFSKRDGEPVSAEEFTIAGFPDNRVELRACRIRDGRGFPTSLDDEGFELVDHRSEFADERDYWVLKEGYQDEVGAVIQARSGAALVLAHRHGLDIRFAQPMYTTGPRAPRDGAMNHNAPNSFAHVDFYTYSMRSGITRDLQLDYGIDAADFSRVVIYQTWRAVSDPPQDVPLALCDRRTLSARDVRRIAAVHSPLESTNDADPNVTFELGGIHFDPGQKWYYFSNMTPDELLVFVGYDSARDRAWVAHSAFDNRANLHGGGRHRESIETRFFALFE